MSLRLISFTEEKERKEEEKKNEEERRKKEEGRRKKRRRRKKEEEKKKKSRFGSMEFMFRTSLLVGTLVYVVMEPLYEFVG